MSSLHMESERCYRGHTIELWEAYLGTRKFGYLVRDEGGEAIIQSHFKYSRHLAFLDARLFIDHTLGVMA